MDMDAWENERKWTNFLSPVKKIHTKANSKKCKGRLADTSSPCLSQKFVEKLFDTMDNENITIIGHEEDFKKVNMTKTLYEHEFQKQNRDSMDINYEITEQQDVTVDTRQPADCKGMVFENGRNNVFSPMRKICYKNNTSISTEEENGSTFQRKGDNSMSPVKINDDINFAKEENDGVSVIPKYDMSDIKKNSVERKVRTSNETVRQHNEIEDEVDEISGDDSTLNTPKLRLPNERHEHTLKTLDDKRTVSETLSKNNFPDHKNIDVNTSNNTLLISRSDDNRQKEEKIYSVSIEDQIPSEDSCGSSFIDLTSSQDSQNDPCSDSESVIDLTKEPSSKDLVAGINLVSPDISKRKHEQITEGESERVNDDFRVKRLRSDESDNETIAIDCERSLGLDNNSFQLKTFSDRRTLLDVDEKGGKSESEDAYAQKDKASQEHHSVDTSNQIDVERSPHTLSLTRTSCSFKNSREFEMKDFPSNRLSSLDADVYIERTRERTERINSPKKKLLDMPCSQWRIKHFAKFFVFDECVRNLNITPSDTLKQNNIDNILDDLQKRLASLTTTVSSQRTNKVDQKINFRDIARTEVGARLILNELFSPLCLALKLHMEIEKNIDCSYLPNCRFDYRFIKPNGRVIGAVEAKSSSGFCIDAVVQAVIELLIIQAEALAERSHNCYEMPFFNILSDGFRYVFIVLKGDKILFETKNDKVVVREIKNWDDMKSLMTSIIAIMDLEESHNSLVEI